MSEGTQMPRDQSHLQEQIDLIAKHEQEFLAQRTSSEKLGDRMASFIGSLTYVAVHIILFSAWIVWNTFSIYALPHFNPPPFPILDVLFAFEAILVASFILMRQGRMSRRAERRDHLNLQIDLISEKEITKVLQLVRAMCSQMGLKNVAEDAELHELSQETSVETLSQRLEDTLPES